MAETVPPDVEVSHHEAAAGQDGTQHRIYRPPPPYPKGLTLKERIARDSITNSDGTAATYQPVWHDDTAQDEDEMCYRSFFMTVEEARTVLKGSVMEDVVRRGWEGIQLRMKMEEG